MTGIDPRALRSAFASYMTGVTVVTARTGDGAPIGFTANSFTSVSLDPPLLLVCPGRHLSSFNAFAEAGHFAVSVLAEGQEDISNVFARPGEDRFAQVGWQADATGCPLISGAAAHFSCTTEQRIEAGDHAILIGRVADFAAPPGPRGLGYCASGYFSLGNERQAEAPARPDRITVACAIIEDGAQVFLTQAMELPEVKLTGQTGARTALAAHLDALGMGVRLGPVYSIYDDAGSGRRHICFLARTTTPGIGAPGQRVAIAQIAQMRFPSHAQTRMMQRFAREHGRQSFGLYIGDDLAGEIHSLQGD